MKRFLLLLPFLLLAAFRAHAVEITGLEVHTGEQADHVSLHLSARTRYKVFHVDGSPPRVAIDLVDARPREKIELPEGYQGTLIRGVRFGFHDEATGRLVLDLSADARPRNIQLEESDNGWQLEFDLTASHEDKGERVVRGESARHEHLKPVIVIDAGHGGQDPGTSGHAGTEEKDLTLRYALALKEALEKTGRYRVALTRDDDYYLLLRDRVKRARAAHGNLFISLHADSAPTRSARGLSVYTISEKASDKESEALAAQENKADVIGGTDLSDASEDVANILIDLAERETRAKSAEFADMAIKHLGREVGLLSNTHRFAGFAVLKAPDIPSVLIEIGFLTNAHEEAQLRSHGYETHVVRGITRAVEEYFARRG